jgi:hypothetical protein
MKKEEEPDDDRLAPSEASDSLSPAPKEPFRTMLGDRLRGPSRGTLPVAKCRRKPTELGQVIGARSKRQA